MNASIIIDSSWGSRGIGMYQGRFIQLKTDNIESVEKLYVTPRNIYSFNQRDINKSLGES